MDQSLSKGSSVDGSQTDGSLSKRGSVDGSQTDVVLSIHSSPPDGIEEKRSSNPVKQCILHVATVTVYGVYYFFSFWGIVMLQIWEIWFPFVVHTIGAPPMCIWGCITQDIKLLAQAASIFPHLIICLIMTIASPITLCTRMLTKKLPPLSVSWEKLFVISCIAVSLDPLFFYIPTIYEKNKCLDMDNKLMIAVLVLRSLSDLFYISRTATRIRQIHGQLVDLESDYCWPLCSLCTQVERRFKLVPLSLQSDSILDSLAILPIQQVAILIAFFRLESSGYPYKTATINIFLVFHLILRAYHVYYSHKRFKIIGNWAKGVLNFYLYILAAHVLGAFWYFFSIQRETSCWHQVCSNTAGCRTTYCCKDTTTSPSVTRLDEFCPVSSENADVFNFGIYLDAFQSGTTGSINFPTKFLYTFWWGLRNLSNFGTNLETSSYVWENFFTVLIAITGLLLFLYLIGNVQTYILWASQKEMADEEEKILTTHKAIDTWLSKHLSSDEYLKKEIVEHIREGKIVEHNYAANKDMDVNVKFFVSILDEYKATCLKEHFCKHAFKRVLRHRSMSKYLSVIIQNLEPVFYKDNSRVVRAREPLDIMLFLTEGVIVAMDEVSNAGVPSRIDKTKFETGDIFGEEMFDLQLNDDAPLSTRTFKCDTKVETFALTYKKWRSIVKDIDRQQNQEPAVVYSNDTDPIILNKAYKKLTTTRWGKIEREIGLKMKMKSDVIKDQELRETMKIFIKEIDILDWLSRNGFSDDAKTKIMTHMRVKGIVKRTIDDEVNVKYLLSQPTSDLPWDIQKSIRKQLGMKSLKKVPMLQNMDNSVLSIMCELYLQPEIYSVQQCLVRAGDPVNLMFIILEGTVVCTEMPSEAAGSSRRLEKGHLYGEHLLSWASPNNLFSGPAPISTEDVICLTKVEALALTASQFRSLVAGFSSQWISNFNMSGGFSQQLDEHMAFPYDKIDKELNETYMQLEYREVGQIEDIELRQKVKIMLKENEILDWVSSVGVSEDIMTQIKQSIKISKVMKENIDVDVNLEYVLSILPSNIKQLLKEHICIDTLKKVSILENVDEDLLNRICLNLEPVILPQDSHVTNADQELDRMIIIVKGAVTCIATSNESTPTPPATKTLEKGDLFGEEILTWAFPNIFSPPISNQDVMCQTKVEALALTVKGLQSVLSYYRDKLYHSDEQWEELTPTTSLSLQNGVVAVDNTVSWTTTLDQILQLQVSQGRRLEEIAAKLGFGATSPAI